jgi:hypothetical protein
MNIKNSLNKYFKKYKDHDDKMEKIFEFFEMFVMEEVKESDHELYLEFMDEFEDYVDFVEKEEIMVAVTHLKKKDGTPGVKWTEEEVASVAHQFNVPERLGEEYCPMLFWYAMNYAYSVHCGTNKTLSAYIELAIEEYLDNNVPLKSKIRLMNERI